MKDQLIWGGVIAAGSSAVAGATAGAVAGLLAGRAEAKTHGGPKGLVAKGSAAASADEERRATARGQPQAAPARSTAIGEAKHAETITSSEQLRNSIGLPAALICCLAFLAVAGITVCLTLLCIFASRFGSDWRSKRIISHEQLSRLPQEDFETAPDTLEPHLEPALAQNVLFGHGELPALACQ